MDWTNDFSLQFLELYRGEPCLWDSSHMDHKKKEKIGDAWQRLSIITGKSVFELKRKKESLMATFRGHLRKKKALMQNGACGDDVYKPIWFAFNYMESFLCQTYDCQPTTNPQDTVYIKIENHDPIVQKSESNDEIHPVNTSVPASSQQTYKRRKNPPELEKIEIKEAFTQPKIVVSKKDDEEEDECDLYCKILAKRLRRLPDFERDFLMYDIDGMVLKAMHQSSYSRGQSSSANTDLPSPHSSPHMSSETILQNTINQQYSTQDQDEAVP